MSGEREGRLTMREGERECEREKHKEREKRGQRDRDGKNREKETSWKSFQINGEMINRTTQGQKMYIWCGQGRVCFRWLYMCV